jgi:hypothetical protein
MSGIEKTLREPPGDIIFSCALIDELFKKWKIFFTFFA